MTNNQMKNVTFLRETVDRESGEVTQTEREGVIHNEPNYIKLYLSGIMFYSDCPAWQNKVLHALLKRIEYETNEINLPAGQKVRITKELNISMSSLNNAIGAFVKKKVLIRVSTGVFMANPHLFGKGDWKAIRKLRLTVDFSPEGVTMEGSVERGEPVPVQEDINNFETVTTPNKEDNIHRNGFSGLTLEDIQKLQKEFSELRKFVTEERNSIPTVCIFAMFCSSVYSLQQLIHIFS